MGHDWVRRNMHARQIQHILTTWLWDASHRKTCALSARCICFRHKSVLLFATILKPFYQSYLECVESYRLCYTSCMQVGVSEITLHLPGCHSLKEKRQVLKSLMARA